MNRQLLLIASVCLFLSCSGNNQDVNIQKDILTDTSTKTTAILFSDPQTIDSSHIVIYPLILEKTSYGSGFSSSAGGKTSFWNLVFYNADDNTQHLLTTDKRIVINSIPLTATCHFQARQGTVGRKG